MAYVINDAGARVLVVGPDFVGHLDQMERELREPYWRGRARRIN